MAQPLDDDGFHPEDPTKKLWKRLLRRKPIPYKKKPVTRQDKKELAKKIQNYYVERQHPRKGAPPKRKKK